MNELQIFSYHDSPVRTIEQNGEAWWVLIDVCKVLNISHVTDVARRLDSDEVGQAEVMDAAGRNQMTYVINEPGLYNVILRSDKPEAKDFKRWVTHEVLPQIRSRGMYQSKPLTAAQLLAQQAQVLVDMEQRMELMQTQTLALEGKVDKAMKVFSRPAEDHWKSDMDAAIKALCEEQHWSVVATKGRMYDELERTSGCSINSRLTRLRKRKMKTGARYKDAMALTKLDAIAADKQLRAIFEGVVRKWQAENVEVGA